MAASAEAAERVGRRRVVTLLMPRIGDLGPGDFVKVDCAAGSHPALLVREVDRLALRAKLAPAFRDWLGLSPPHRHSTSKNARCRARDPGQSHHAIEKISPATELYVLQRSARQFGEMVRPEGFEPRPTATSRSLYPTELRAHWGDGPAGTGDLCLSTGALFTHLSYRHHRD
jgi:hypothetical protein